MESEILRWKPFRKALQTEADRQAFDALMDMCRNNAMASGATCNPIIFEPMVMSILLSPQKEIRKLRYRLNEIIWEMTKPPEEKTRDGKQPINTEQPK